LVSIYLVNIVDKPLLTQTLRIGDTYSGTFLCAHIGTMKHLGGFPITGGTLGQDNLIQAKVLDAGYEFHVCNGIYIYHWYRADDPYEHSKKTIESLEKVHYESLKL
jgi:hypothetical protein